MGLDSVALVMEFEDTFKIEISNEAAATLETIGDVVDYVTARFVAEGRLHDREGVLRTVKRITCERCGTTLDKLTESTSFVNDLGID
jgi:acyl carrier protein